MKGFERPPMVTLPESSLVPTANQVAPPERLTHRVTASEPYWYEHPGGEPSGHFPAGTEVAVLHHDGRHAWVTDARGLMVAVRREALGELA
jgi:hypothetical protein